MKRSSWRKQHKWFGLVLSFFILMFCLSGLILNHRNLFSDINISRSILPHKYHYKAWNNGLLRGSIPLFVKGEKKILIYGSDGLILTDSLASSFSHYNKGLPKGVDKRAIRSLVQTKDKQLWAISQFNLYQRNLQDITAWQSISLQSEGERLTDLTIKGDSLIVLSRSFVYISKYPYKDFIKNELKPYEGYKKKASAFRTIWLLHSGEMFGILGKLFVDFLAICLIILCFTGLIYFFVPKYTKYFKTAKKKGLNLMSKMLKLHNLVGKKAFYFLLFMVITGAFLRPPLLIPIARLKVPIIPYTKLDKTNPWNDKLRMIRFDEEQKLFLVSTSEGLYELENLQAIPKKIKKAPPISVMGLNVWEKDKENPNYYIMGSFQGLFRCDKKNRQSYKYDTNELVKEFSSIPFGKKAISGYSDDFTKPFYVEYNDGTDSIPMPKEYKYLPMSLWHLALEVHTGRIYTFMGLLSMFFIFLSALSIFWLLLSGIKIGKR